MLLPCCLNVQRMCVTGFPSAACVVNHQSINQPIGSIGFTRRAGATRYTHGSIADMLQKFPGAIAALDPQWLPGQQQQQSGRELQLQQQEEQQDHEEPGVTQPPASGERPSDGSSGSSTQTLSCLL